MTSSAAFSCIDAQYVGPWPIDVDADLCGLIFPPELIPSAIPETPGGLFSALMRGSMLLTSKGETHEHANRQGQFDPREGQFNDG